MEQSTAMQHIDSFPLHQCVYPQAVSRWTPKMSHTSIGLDMFRWFSMVQLGRLKPWFFLFKCKGFNRIFPPILRTFSTSWILLVDLHIMSEIVTQKNNVLHGFAPWNVTNFQGQQAHGSAIRGRNRLWRRRDTVLLRASAWKNDEAPCWLMKVFSFKGETHQDNPRHI